MPQPANSRTVSPCDLGGAQGDAPLAVAVGVHPADRAGVAAAVHALDLGDQVRSRPRWACRRPRRDGCSAAASSSEETVAASWTTPATSVARCMTLGRCSTNGASGTFIDEQCGSSGVGDRADGVLVLLEVLRRPGQRGGEGEVALVVAGTPDGAGQHPRGDQAALAADQHLRRRAEHAVDVEGPAHRVAARPAGAAASARRSAASAVATRSRASTTFSRSPASIRRDRVGDHAHPAARRRGRRRRRPRRPAAPGGSREPHGRASRRGCRGRWWSARSRPPRRPTTTSGTTSTESPGSSAKAKRAEADQAGAGLVDLVADDRRGLVGLGPPLVGVGEPGRAARCGSRRRRPSRPGPRRGAAR